MRKLQDMLQQRQQTLQDHESGHRRLSPDVHAQAHRQLNVYARTLHQLQSESTEARRERLLEHLDTNVNRLDYVDFTQTGLQG
jgi:hypothetical protein